ncbi:MAG TPA: hypothetical protein VEG64_16905 [Candidatus Sulfotelmatobacter sp.]|nr:hypothetical protein [Candidatus Sulfotelmatobacter sp.]
MARIKKVEVDVVTIRELGFPQLVTVKQAVKLVLSGDAIIVGPVKRVTGLTEVRRAHK